MNGLEVASPGLLANSSLAPMEQCGQETPLENVLFASFYLLDFILAFVGNALALWLFIRDHKSGTPANVFLMHLAVADLSCVLVLPTRLVYHFSGSHWPFGEIPCRLTGFLFYLNMYASIYFLTCISADRYVAIARALPAGPRPSAPGRAHLVSVIVWLLSLLLALPALLFSQDGHREGQRRCRLIFPEGLTQTVKGASAVENIVT